MKTIRMEDLPERIGLRDFLNSVASSREELVLEQNGAPQAVILPPNMARHRQHVKEELAEIIARIRARNPGVDSDEVLEELEAIDRAG